MVGMTPRGTAHRDAKPETTGQIPTEPTAPAQSQTPLLAWPLVSLLIAVVPVAVPEEGGEEAVEEQVDDAQHLEEECPCEEQCRHEGFRAGSLLAQIAHCLLRIHLPTGHRDAWP